MTNQIQQQRPRTIHELLKTHKDQIAAALPKHLTADRMCRIALTEVRKNPKLLDCDPISLFGSIVQASQLGLEIGSGGAHLVPFKKQVQMIPDYRGLMSLARRPGDIDVIYAQIVREHDRFAYQYGTDEYLRFQPERLDRGNIIYVFAIAKYKSGACQFECLTLDEIEARRGRSRAKDDGPWVTDFEPMAKKTAIRQLCTYLPSSAELQRVIGLDDLNDRGIGQDNRAVILDGDFNIDPEPTGKPDVTMPQAQP